MNKHESIHISSPIIFPRHLIGGRKWLGPITPWMGRALWKRRCFILLIFTRLSPRLFDSHAFSSIVMDDTGELSLSHTLSLTVGSMSENGSWRDETIRRQLAFTTIRKKAERGKVNCSESHLPLRLRSTPWQDSQVSSDYRFIFILTLNERFN